MDKDGVHRLQSKRTVMQIGIEELNQFQKLMNSRDIRRTTVRKLKRVLESGDHFETPLVTNYRNNKHRLLDGNHRIEAMAEYFKMHPERKVEVAIFYYENMNEEQERIMYSKWNAGGKQTTNDFVKQYWTSIPIVKKIEHDSAFPFGVSHVWTTNAIEFKQLFGSYLTIDNKTYNGEFVGNAIEFIERVKELGDKDLQNVKAFLTEYIEVFGTPSRKNIHYKRMVFVSMFRIWLDNHSRIGYQKMKDALLRLRNHPLVVHYGGIMANRKMDQMCRNEFLQVINGTRRTRLFL